MIDKAASSDLSAGSLPASGLSASQKARLIYDTARSEMSGRLWRAALGSADEAEVRDGGPAAAVTGRNSISQSDPIGLDRLLAILDPQSRAALDAAAVPQAGAPAAIGSGEAVAAMGDGPNARYAGMLDAAAERTGLPASALAAIVDAEAARGSGGAWQPYSRNPRSSAAGLGQFLSGTWEGEAERAGTWLNAAAQGNGWLDARGQVKAENRGALLALRYDPRASIEAVADYASANVAALRRSGATIGAGTTEVAQAAYLGHHLGLGDAKRFLAGGLSPDRARKLLGAQVGSAAAERRIAQAGSAVAAHRSWLMDYVGTHVRPERFA
ncbi:peptidoglycan-binding protein [Novosphingobium guangzhouense]|uniref:Peptidoglycan-binding protein n=1 Tax=Novosphingobium guangzhouense TaxID=1850347 RepID=A0A2K2FVC4_9SPHN|nr:peptidoglycan-binding protein [Novosphingobium guangzhouense]PNU02723.1 peptidoglycan-binding protein [Novosphingobium guangzhouense]